MTLFKNVGSYAIVLQLSVSRWFVFECNLPDRALPRLTALLHGHDSPRLRCVKCLRTLIVSIVISHRCALRGTLAAEKSNRFDQITLWFTRIVVFDSGPIGQIGDDTE